jgi:Lrp/AsnC family leucine-responsive transcriptional regulator
VVGSKVVKGGNEMSLKLDNIDASILELLQKDGRMMFKDLARAVGVSLPTVRDRINKLSELGVIKKFTVIVDSEKLWGRVSVLIFAEPPSDDDEMLAEKIKGIHQIRTGYLISGEKRLLLQVELDDIKELNEFVSKTLKTRLGISYPTSAVVTKVLKEEYGATVKSNVILHFKCDFCNAVIYGKPVIEYISGARYYFSGQDCAQAFKEKRLKSNSPIQRS